MRAGKTGSIGRCLKLQPDTPSASRLMQHGVKLSELEAVRIFVFDWQAGAAITLAVPLLGPVILIKRRWLVYDAGGELADNESLKKLRHEMCHVRQILDWGGLVYLRRQLWARVKTGSLYARASPEERECYTAEARVTCFYRSRQQG